MVAVSPARVVPSPTRALVSLHPTQAILPMSIPVPRRRARRWCSVAALTGAGALATLAAVAPPTVDQPEVRAAADEHRPVVTSLPVPTTRTSAPLSDQVLIAASTDEVEPAPEPAEVERAQAAAPPEPAPEPVRSVWDQVAECESHGEWDYGPHSDWGNGLFEGGLQFDPDTWDAYKDPGMPGAAYEATRAQQIMVAERVLAEQGWAAWPVCSRKLGLR